ncbi:Acetylornithine aminotransferase [Sporomusa silvacetica DSM 10669]|uniref:alanine--glyoxylate transaminase n=1 Tax=Sporomusa silvacetica DSM 10669 TaxID=1123289 RepID=A0ABZ3IMT3_9FIRM|nr:aspartate aminotransferase family protein [Sporomusa silvacetica]OZC18142.1 acetylornithine aminotransferase [Sporomusa silvacetica DSM 10669]
MSDINSSQYIGPEKILQKKQDYIIPCVYHFYNEPMQLVKGEMQYLYDHTGKQYLDCFAGVSVVNCGHCNPEITKAICDQVQTLQHTCTIYLTENIVNLAERLAQITPGRLQKTFFCSSGTEANEGAALLASIYTGKQEFISLRQGLHGRTKLTMSLTGLSLWRTDTNPVGGISFAPNAYCYRCPYGKRHPECDLACANEIEGIIKTATSGQVAAFFAEPIQGNGGIITPPPGYFKRVKEILNKYNILLIIDEVQTGFGRTGKMFAIEHYGVEPDIMTMAKALGNGVPVGAFTSRPEIADTYTRPGASTLGGNPVTSAAALATLDVIAKNNLPARAAELGKYLKRGLTELQKKHPLIGDIRGHGLMLGAELVNPDKSPAAQQLDTILEQMKDRGFLFGKNGPDRNVMAFQPPLVITREDLDNLLNNLADVLAHIA